MIDLIINGRPVDLPDSGISILFQRQRTDYTNPTIVRNSFTKTIKLPGTKTNNDIFSNLWKLDKYINNHFNDFVPSRRVPFMLLKEGNLVEMGYVKLNNIAWDGNFYTYEVTLYGELGNLLYGLSYNIDEETEEVSPLTLANLDFGFDSFIINKDLIEAAWGRLDGDEDYMTDDYKMFDTINFMVSYDGAPSANNFDPKDIWCSVHRLADVYWRNKRYYANEFPTTITEDNITYKYMRTMVSRMDPDDHYGLLELKNEISPLEARDLRSYLLRPVVKVKDIFNAIGKYIEDHFGYTLDMTDDFFNEYEFNSTWMTLSMLYEIDPDVETGTIFTKNQLFSNTSSPASYLISYCKTYGIYMDVDVYSKKLVLTRLPRFFDENKIDELEVDTSRNISINPLSFDKASYTFDYDDGEGEFVEKYKNAYGIQYGSKKVNTGYRFDASTAPYIDNNVFRVGLDSVDQSVYYRHPYSVRGNHLFDYPIGLMDEYNAPSYKLFNKDDNTGEIRTIDGTMSPNWYPIIHSGDTYYQYDVYDCGYQYLNSWWIGLRPGVWQDSFPKLQCHSDDNKNVDGRNILVMFNGFKSSSYGYWNDADPDRYYFVTETYSDYQIDATKVNYLLSDDYAYLKEVLGKNCYYDCPVPSPAFDGVSPYLKVINRIPSFSRCEYDFSRDTEKIPIMYVSNFNQYNISGTESTTVSSYQDYFYTVISASSGRQYPYFSDYNFDMNHRYFIAAAIRTNSASAIKQGNDYAHPDIIGSTLVESKDLDYGSNVMLVASIVDTGDTVLNQITPLSAYDAASEISFNTYYLAAYDLTALNLVNRITTIDDAIKYFSISAQKIGYPYNIVDTLDFGISRELYVPSCTFNRGIGIFDEYWRNYISDVYSINTKIMNCYCRLDNIDDVFRRFYYYDNCLWILSKITDWDITSKWCKGTFVKVNNINNYVQ